jgi:hypothetical protein
MIRTRYGLALGLLLLSCCLSWAEVKIKPDCRIPNSPPGRCGWCALETLARHHKLEALYGLSEKNASRCTAANLQHALDGKGIKYRIQEAGNNDPSILKAAITERLGAVVGFRELYPGAGGHIVTLIDFTEDAVKVIDSNDEDCQTRTMSLERFLYWWDGFALVLEAKGKAPEYHIAQEKESKAVYEEYGIRRRQRNIRWID